MSTTLSVEESPHKKGKFADDEKEKVQNAHTYSDGQPYTTLKEALTAYPGLRGASELALACFYLDLLEW